MKYFSSNMMEFLPYYGGKGGSDLSRWLYNNFNLEGINNYVEPFGGMFGIYFSPYTNFDMVKNIIYNDIDTQNCNVINCAKTPLAYYNEIHKAFKSPNGLFYYSGLSEDDIYKKYKQFYTEYQKGIKKLPVLNVNSKDYTSALIYTFLRTLSMKSLHYLTTGPRGMRSTTWYKRYKILQPVVNKLKDHSFVNDVVRINVNAEDYKVIMNKYNSTDSFIYIDPPYKGREKNYDPHKKGVYIDKDHQILAEMVKQSEARVAISYYYFDGIYDLYPRDDFRYETKNVFNSAGKNQVDELLIMNYKEKSDVFSSTFYKYKGAYFTDEDNMFELTLPEDDSIIEPLDESRETEYRGDNRTTLELIKLNENNILLGNSIDDSKNRIDYLIDINSYKNRN